MVLPIVKLGTLAIKTISKPIASRLKKEAGRHPKFRSLIVRFAQSNHRITTTMQRRIYGHATDVEIRPLNEDRAVQAAADLMGELFVFSVAVVALIFEVQRSSRSEAKKEELRRQEIEGLREEIKQVRERYEERVKEVELLKQQFAEIERIARGHGLAGAFNFGGIKKPFLHPKPLDLAKFLRTSE